MLGCTFRETSPSPSGDLSARQHLLGNTADHAFAFVKPSGLLNQHGDGHDRPFVAHASEHLVHLPACGKGTRLGEG